MAGELVFDDSPPRRQAPRPVTTVAELAQLDEAAIMRGYRAGRDSAPDYAERDRGYWHGYLNGQVDRGVVQPSPEQQALARDYVRHLADKRRVQNAGPNNPTRTTT